MRKSKFSESQIVGILKDAESGVPVADLIRKYGVSKATFFKWRSKYGGASVSDVKRLRELETENAKLKRMYADLARSRTQPSKTCSTESCKAVREAADR
jgi:putative transposase